MAVVDMENYNVSLIEVSSDFRRSLFTQVIESKSRLGCPQEVLSVVSVVFIEPCIEKTRIG